MNDYINFEGIPKIALSDACIKFIAPIKLVEQLSKIYFKPIVFEDVLSALKSLKESNVKTGILSNGTQSMLQSGIEINTLNSFIDVVYSADDIKIFKPHPSVYQMVCDGENCDPNDILFISSNQWDIAGAYKFGFKTAWLNRNESFRENIISSTDIIEINSPQDITSIIS